MAFEYRWKKKEANFGLPVETEVSGGTHVSCESVLKFNGQYVALRRPEAIPEHEIPKKALTSGKSHLYFVHGLPRWGETMEAYVGRVIKEQAGVGVRFFKIVDLQMEVYDDSQQWAWTPVLIVELDRLPDIGTHGNEVIEVMTFDKDSIPEDFGWWTKEEFEEFIKKHDN